MVLSLHSPERGLVVCNTHRVTASFPSLKATLALQEKRLEKGAEEMPRASGIGRSLLAALSLPGVHTERLAGKEASPHSPGAELSVGTHGGKKDFAEALVVGGLIQACPEYSRGAAWARGNIYFHPHFPPHLVNQSKHRLCL